MLHVLAIGIEHYADPDIQDLDYAARDAEEFAWLLEDRLSPKECQVHRLVNEDATRRNIMTALGRDLPGRVSSGDVCMIFFAGHGSPETGSTIEDTTRFLVTHDTEVTNIFATGIDMEHEVQRCLQRIPDATVVILFLDCCFSGRAGGRSFKGPRLKSLLPSFRGDMCLSLADIDFGKGRAIITACNDTQGALVDIELQHGIFTYHLLSLLKRPRENQRAVPVATVYAELAHAVFNHTGGMQVPVMHGHLENTRLPILHS